MDWFDYFLQIAVLGTFVWILKTIFFRPKFNKTQHLEINDDLPVKNKTDERINTESSSENSCLNFENLKNFESSEVINTTDSYEDEECYETCNNVSYKNNNQEKINMTNVMECSGYGTTEEEIQNIRLNMSNESQHNLDIHNSLLEIILRDSSQRKNTNSFVHNASIGTGIDLQNSNLESTEDEGNESQLGSSQEELKKKTFFSDRKHKNVKRFTPIDTDDFESNENAQLLAEINTNGSYQNNSINNFSFNSSKSRSEEENYSNLKNVYGCTTLEILNQFTYSDESDNCSHLLEYSKSLPSSIHGDNSSFQNMKDSQFTHSSESQEVSDFNSSHSSSLSSSHSSSLPSSHSSSLPSSIHRNDSSLQNIQFQEDNDLSFISSTASNDEMNFAFIENE